VKPLLFPTLALLFVELFQVVVTEYVLRLSELAPVVSFEPEKDPEAAEAKPALPATRTEPIPATRIKLRACSNLVIELLYLNL
jgi:hypothetical protein